MEILDFGDEKVYEDFMKMFRKGKMTPQEYLAQICGSKDDCDKLDARLSKIADDLQYNDQISIDPDSDDDVRWQQDIFAKLSAAEEAIVKNITRKASLVGHINQQKEREY